MWGPKFRYPVTFDNFLAVRTVTIFSWVLALWSFVGREQRQNTLPPFQGLFFWVHTPFRLVCKMKTFRRSILSQSSRLKTAGFHQKLASTDKSAGEKNAEKHNHLLTCLQKLPFRHCHDTVGNITCLFSLRYVLISFYI